MTIDEARNELFEICEAQGYYFEEIIGGMYIMHRKGCSGRIDKCNICCDVFAALETIENWD